MKSFGRLARFVKFRKYKKIREKNFGVYKWALIKYQISTQYEICEIIIYYSKALALNFLRFLLYWL